MTGCASAQAATGPGVGDALLARARERGAVLVIVTLRVPAGAGPEQVQSTKAAVLAAVAPTRHRVVRALSDLPQLVIEASEETLRLLAGTPEVARIEESAVRRPVS